MNTENYKTNQSNNVPNQRGYSPQQYNRIPDPFPFPPTTNNNNFLRVHNSLTVPHTIECVLPYNCSLAHFLSSWINSPDGGPFSVLAHIHHLSNSILHRCSITGVGKTSRLPALSLDSIQTNNPLWYQLEMLESNIRWKWNDSVCWSDLIHIYIHKK